MMIIAMRVDDELLFHGWAQRPPMLNIAYFRNEIRDAGRAPYF